MACEPPPPVRKKLESLPAAPTTICALGDDLLREIFLRLPSLPTLVRAALACSSSLRAVRSSPAFRRRFRELHSPPLLGLFLDIFEPNTPAFRPLCLRSDPDIAAVVRGADFFLTRLPDDIEGSAPEWFIRDCHDGYVLLLSFSTLDIAVYNPLTRALHRFPEPPYENGEETCIEFHVLRPEEDQGPFRVICVCHNAYGAQAAVLSSETSEWQFFPWVDTASVQLALQPAVEEYSSAKGNLVNGFIYWPQANRASARVLNTWKGKAHLPLVRPMLGSSVWSALLNSSLLFGYGEAMMMVSRDGCWTRHFHWSRRLIISRTISEVVMLC